jgi:hypothetical protein
VESSKRRMQNNNNKKVGSGTETKMRRNEVMALVFCLVGSCPLLPLPLQSRPQPLQQINRTDSISPSEILRFLPYFSLVLRNLRCAQLFCSGCRCPGMWRCCWICAPRWGTPTERHGVTSQ